GRDARPGAQEVQVGGVVGGVEGRDRDPLRRVPRRWRGAGEGVVPGRGGGGRSIAVEVDRREVGQGGRRGRDGLGSHRTASSAGSTAGGTPGGVGSGGSPGPW